MAETLAEAIAEAVDCWHENVDPDLTVNDVFDALEEVRIKVTEAIHGSKLVDGIVGAPLPRLS